jgi:hypothetical protein
VAPILARHLSAALTQWEGRWPQSRQLPERITRVLNLSLAVLLTVAVGVWARRQLQDTTLQEHIDRQIPTAAFDWLAGGAPRENLFNSYNWGGYVLWRLFPEYASFVDGRTDVFSERVLEDYVRAWSAGPGWSEVLEAYRIETVLIEPEAPLAQVLDASGWSQVYQDEAAVVFRRQAGP